MQTVRAATFNHRMHAGTPRYRTLWDRSRHRGIPYELRVRGPAAPGCRPKQGGRSLWANPAPDWARKSARSNRVPCAATRYELGAQGLLRLTVPEQPDKLSEAFAGVLAEAVGAVLDLVADRRRLLVAKASH